MILLPKRPVVVHVTPWYLPHIGGLERHVEAISNHIGGFDSVILTPRLPGTSRIDRPSERVTIVRFGPTKFPAERGRTRSISSQEWVLEEYDHVICVDPSGYRRAKSIQASDPGRFEKVKIHHMPQPIDTNLFHSEPLPVGPELRVGYSGRWERDGMFLLRELVSMNLPGVRYCISGGATPRDLHEYAHA